MLKYCTTILKNVSFDKKLFKKELIKSIKWLSYKEKVILRNWCLVYIAKYEDIIINSFQDLV